jgi:hypothetical protein
VPYTFTTSTINSKPHVYFTAGGSGCGASYIGMQRFKAGPSDGQWFSGQAITLNCFDTRTIHHEIGHAIGLWHEQQRCDRDTFVVVSGGDDVNYGKRCGSDAKDYGLYNYASVMHYYPDSVLSIRNPLPPSSTYNGNPPSSISSPSLNVKDIEAINQMYP